MYRPTNIMNLFYLSRVAREAAQAHCNKHVVKMILELAQQMCTAHRLLDGSRTPALTKTGRKTSTWGLPDQERDSLLYKATHANHPMVVWVRSSREHYLWTFELFQELLLEYTFRYGKIHACTKLTKALSEPPAAIIPAGFTDPPTCMPDCYRVKGDAVECYRAYYREGKKDLLQYKLRERPAWLEMSDVPSS